MMENTPIGVGHFSITEESSRERLSSSRMILDDISPDYSSTISSTSGYVTAGECEAPGEDDKEENFAKNNRKSREDKNAAFATFEDRTSTSRPHVSSTTHEGGEKRRFPCKARNVGDDHTNEKAYLDLPPNPCHGFQMVCSHPACEASGRAFRWCEVCQIIVAKRNFMKRHSHGLMIATRTTSSTTSRRRIREAKTKTKILPSPSPYESLISVTMKNDEEPKMQENGAQDAGWARGMVSSRIRESSNCGTVEGGPFREGAVTRGSTFERNDNSFSSLEPESRYSSLEPGFLDQAVALSMREIQEDEENDSIAEIGSLNGWDQTDLDSIFD